MKLFFQRITSWRDGVVVDAMSAAGEAALALFFSSLWVLVLVITIGLRTSDADFGDAALAAIDGNFKAADALQYLTAILSSTTAYTLVRLYGVRDHLPRVVVVLLLTVLLWYAAIPLFVVPEPPNVEFAANLAISLITAGLAVWWFSLFSQRRIFERTPTGPSEEGANRVAKGLEKYR